MEHSTDTKEYSRTTFFSRRKETPETMLKIQHKNEISTFWKNRKKKKKGKKLKKRPFRERSFGK